MANRKAAGKAAWRQGTAPPRCALAILVLAWFTPASAGESPPRLDLPIACRPGADCWVVNYVDLDPSPGVRDYARGRATYDGHKGTDIAVRDREAMRRGVPVLAAAPGVVRATRDGMADDGIETSGKAPKGRACGNGVIIGHGGGWETQYCHMRMGSVAVTPGQRLRQGQVLGMVGMSGRAAFPHVHFALRRGGRVMDPFVGLGPTVAYDPGPGPLWTQRALARLSYRPTALYHAGFAGSVPGPEAVREGRFDGTVLTARSPALILWVDIFRVRAGDSLNFRIVAPDGRTILESRTVIQKTQARRYAYAGKRLKGPAWPTGTYRGEIMLVRGKETGENKVYLAERCVTLR